MTTLVFAPNWLGDAVMALPALADIRRDEHTGRMLVAARPAVAGLMEIVPGIDGVVQLAGRGGLSSLRHHAGDVRAIADAHADVAILFPNSVHAALLASRAGIGRRCGYRRDFRGGLLTRAVPRPGTPLHQVDYYRQLVAALGCANGPREPQLDLAPGDVDAARALLNAAGWAPDRRLVGIAPGAAYGGAKRWAAARFAAVIAGLASAMPTTAVLVGSAADIGATCAIEAELGKISGQARSTVVNLAGRTDIRQLAGVMALCRAFVSNDSGAMHLAAAVGVPVVALFGPTDPGATAPVGRRSATILTAPAWCRPCMLRECPLDHRCMTGIGAAEVMRAVEDQN